MSARTTGLRLPQRSERPRSRGLTMVIDNGMPLHAFEDAVDSASDYIDSVKFGWGTALVTAKLTEKIDCLRRSGIDYYFGGTLFEKFAIQHDFEAYLELCHSYGCPLIEISNGTIPMSNRDKASYISRAAEEFTVLSEVGYKDSDRCLQLSGDDWARCIAEDLAAGATRVITEARESGRSGICRPDGTLRFELIERILAAGTDANHLVFEAPTKELQSFFVKRIGPEVNLANVAPTDVIGCETLRLGLRSDTLMHYELEGRLEKELAAGA
ncbi:MAG: phosphosulfolactate synthase [Acidimicrobiales bacterium]